MSKIIKYINKNFLWYNLKRQWKNHWSFCCAPFNTLEFHIDGGIRVCCGNRYKIVGHYPEQDIDGIFNGLVINKLRDNLKNYDLSDGCQMCYRMLLNRDYVNLFAKDYDIFQISSDEILRNLKFELSNICNLECEMCWGELSSSIRRNIEHLPPQKSIYSDDFVEKLKPYWKNIQKATFLGGEPFLIPIYYKIWEDIIQNNPEIDIFIITNGTILNKKIKELLKSAKFYFAISIDSFNKDNYEKIRRNASFDATMQNLDYFYEYSKYYNRKLTVNICPMQQN